jgi:hypothetical protein
MEHIRIQLFKRYRGQWILRTTITQPTPPRVHDWLKSPFAQQLINKHVSVLGFCHVTHSVQTYAIGEFSELAHSHPEH